MIPFELLSKRQQDAWILTANGKFKKPEDEDEPSQPSTSPSAPPAPKPKRTRKPKEPKSKTLVVGCA
jgi:hypothetical protein